MAIQTFVASTVLTAAQMNALQANDYNQTVSTKTASYTLVAADKGTKIVMNSASATTITVNTSLFAAGDTLTILNIAAGVCTVTAGTATVSTTGSLALAQNGGGTLYFTSAGVSVFQANGVTASSGLVCVKAETSFSAVSTINVNNVFSATYTNYLVNIVFDNSATHDINMRLRVGGVDNSTVQSYKRQSLEVSSSTVTGLRSDGESFLLGAGSTTAPNIIQVNIFQPFVADETPIMSYNMRSTSNGVMFSNWAFHNQAVSYDGFSLLTSSGTTTGTFSVYGYSKTV